MTQVNSGMLDPQPIGQLQSMTIKAAIIGIISMLVAFGFKVFATDAQVQAIAEGVGALVTLGSLVFAWYGRVRAKQVVVTGASGPKLPAILLLLMVPVAGTGCQALSNVFSPATTQPATPQTQLGRIYEFKQVYTVALNGFASAMQAGYFSKDQIKLIMAVSGEIDNGIDQAEKAVTSGDKAGADFWLARLEDALNRYLELKTNTAPTARPTTRPIGAVDLNEVPRWEYLNWYWNQSEPPKRWPLSINTRHRAAS